MNRRYHCADPTFAQFVAAGTKWNKDVVSYDFLEVTRDPAVQGRVAALMRSAFDLWEEACGLSFLRVSDNNADIRIRFVEGAHGDGHPFQGPGAVLAHAFYPGNYDLAGDCHFDDAERWGDGSGDSMDLITIAAHEIGHAIGLAHSDVRDALMYPYYSGPHRFLHADDVAGAQSLYGAAEPEPPEEPDMAEWPPFAIRRPGPPNKSGGYQQGDSGPKRGEVKHSAVGFEAGMWAVLDDPFNGTSWHYSVMYDGTVYAHYARSAHTWHGNDSDPDGAIEANIDTVGTEHEGGPPGNESEPLTEPQYQSSLRLTRWLMEQDAKDRATRYPDQSGFVECEHNQVGNSGTACPSNRIPWARMLADLNQTPPGPPEELPRNEQVAHAAGFLYAAFYKQDPSLLHPYDRGVIRRALDAIDEWERSK